MNCFTIEFYPIEFSAQIEIDDKIVYIILVGWHFGKATKLAHFHTEYVSLHEAYQVSIDP